jgi:hypothetical protein
MFWNALMEVFAMSHQSIKHYPLSIVLWSLVSIILAPDSRQASTQAVGGSQGEGDLLEELKRNKEKKR